MGLFDRIKKSLFGKKDEEDENKKEENRLSKKMKLSLNQKIMIKNLKK